MRIMLDELENWMNQKKMASYRTVQGHAESVKTENPAAYERVQFMKYFRGFQEFNHLI